jgi:hypothetical protein
MVTVRQPVLLGLPFFMAENKNSFVLYRDIRHTVYKLSNEKAGELFKLILGYVSDENPKTDDLLVQIAFEPIKQSLKRDLILWEQKRQVKSESGRVGGIKSGKVRRSESIKKKQNEANKASLQNTKQNKANGSEVKQNEANEAVSAIVSVSVSDSVNKSSSSKAEFLQNHTWQQNFAQTERLTVTQVSDMVKWFVNHCDLKGLSVKNYTSLFMKFYREGDIPQSVYMKSKLPFPL